MPLTSRVHDAKWKPNTAMVRDSQTQIDWRGQRRSLPSRKDKTNTGMIGPRWENNEKHSLIIVATNAIISVWASDYTPQFTLCHLEHSWKAEKWPLPRYTQSRGFKRKRWGEGNRGRTALGFVAVKWWESYDIKPRWLRALVLPTFKHTALPLIGSFGRSNRAWEDFVVNMQMLLWQWCETVGPLKESEIHFTLDRVYKH